MCEKTSTNQEQEVVLSIGEKFIGEGYPTYFIADIGANHDGDLTRAKDLIYLCAESGADAAKFQHFRAQSIVSDKGFKVLDPKYLSHQSSWKKSVYEVYQEAAIDPAWDQSLRKTCDDAGIAYLTTPYALDLVDDVDRYVAAFKIGSGDITWIENIQKIASKGKPVILACGASSLDDIVRAADAILQINPQLSILQCNTNYTGDLGNLDYVNLSVIKTLSDLYPGLILGLSDHTPGHVTALGAVALGGKIIEKHFTDDNHRIGPDHGFAMNPVSWKEMIEATRQLERALGNGVKKVEDNEIDTVVIQRRALRTRVNLDAGHIIKHEDVEVLRPCPEGAIEPWQVGDVIGKKMTEALGKGAHFKWDMFEE